MFQPSQIGGAGFRWPIHSDGAGTSPQLPGGVWVFVTGNISELFLVDFFCGFSSNN